MPYLHGDATPFPLDCDFIETLKAFLGAAVSMLAADEQLEELGHKAEAARADAERERERVDRVTADVLGALDPHQTGGDRGQGLAAEIAVAARQVSERNRAEITQRREALLRDLEAQAARARALVPRALEQFFARHELPDTRWRLRFSARLGERTQVQAMAVTPQKLDLALDVELPPDHAFARAVRVADLAPGIMLSLPVDKTFLRRGPRREPLDRWFVTEAELDGDRARVVVRRSDHKPSDGLELDVRGRVSVRRVDETGVGAHPAIALEGEGAEGVRRLAAAIAGPLGELARQRGALVRATVDGRPLAGERRPAPLVAELIAGIAPLVRAMGERSTTPGELALKRDLGNGRREESYVSRTELLAILAPLSPGRRAYFDDLALAPARGVTQEPTLQVEIERIGDDEDPTHDGAFAAVTTARLERRAAS